MEVSEEDVTMATMTIIDGGRLTDFSAEGMRIAIGLISGYIAKIMS